MVTERDKELIGALQKGLPLVRRPYAALGERVGMGEQEVLRRLADLRAKGVIRRHGVIVRHHELGYRANAMSVWAIPDERIDDLGEQLAGEPGVTLCYRRRTAPPAWPYNLYCMIHGQDREAVLARRRELAEKYGLDQWAHRVLFSGRRFKQRGAWYRPPQPAPEKAEVRHG